MITILFSMTVKAEREADFRKTVEWLTRTTHAEDEGCLAYVFYRQVDHPRECVLYEQWRDAEALGAHVRRLQEHLGPPSDDEPFPPTHHRRRLPASFLELLERTDAVRYVPALS